MSSSPWRRWLLQHRTYFSATSSTCSTVPQGQPAEISASAPGRHIECAQREDTGLQRRRDVPAHDPFGVDVGDARDISEPRPRRNIGHVSDPQPRGPRAMKRRCKRSAGSTEVGSSFVVNTRIERLTSEQTRGASAVPSDPGQQPSSGASKERASSDGHRRHSPPRAGG